MRVVSKLACVILAAIGSVGVAATGAPAAPVARFADGTAAGSIKDGVTSFLGLPYAAPPVGDLRWAPPHAARRWKGVREAKAFSPACAQTAAWITEAKSEDCLYLNVWTPTRRPASGLPVIVWIHGGGYYGGSGAQPLYDGARLTRRGVIVVTFNYRLGVFGFFAHPELTAREQTFGNQGLLDQVAALRWVKRNVSAVGGDPRRVTIMGESAGAGSVAVLTASRMASGLFQRAIAESGSDDIVLSGGNDVERETAAAEAEGANLGDKLGKPSLASLRAATTAELLKQPWSPHPVHDGRLIPRDAHEAYRSGSGSRVPLLLGWNSNEGVDLAPEILGTDRFTVADFPRLAERLLKRPMTPALRSAYPASNDAEARASIERLTSDWWGARMWSWANVHSTTLRLPTYVYYFVHWPTPPSSPCTYGCRAGHGAEIPFVFDQLGRDARPWRAGDRALSDRMAAYWTNFAKRGDPNGPDLPTWPRFDGGRASVKRFGDEAEIRERGDVASPLLR